MARHPNQKQLRRLTSNRNLRDIEDFDKGSPNYFHDEDELAFLYDEPLFNRDSDISYALKDLDFVDIRVTYPHLATEEDFIE